MSGIAAQWRDVRWPGLLAGAVVTGIVALSVHVVMLQVLMVPYPVDRPKVGWTIYAGLVGTAWALMWFYRLTRDKFAGMNWGVRVLVLFVLTAMLKESLIRIPVMDSIATSAWRYSFADGLAKLFAPFLVCLLVVAVGQRLNRGWQRVLVAVAIGVVAEFVCEAWLLKAHAAWMASIASLGHDEVWKFPYDWHIQVPAYLTYAEPVAACFVMCSMVWDRLSGRLRVGQFALMVVLTTGVLAREVLYPFVARAGVGAAVVSMGQFLLEALVLGVGTAVTWRMFGGSKA